MVEKKNNILNYLGVFSSALLVAVAAVYIYSPVVGSFADGSASTKVTTVVNPVASVTLDSDIVAFDVAPTIDGAFMSDSITATAQTNSTGGYELYFSSVDDSTDMVHSNDSISDVISSSFSDSVGSADMPANSWGYSLDNTSFSKIPTINSAAIIRNIDHYPEENETKNTVYIGTKISNTLASGSYSKSVVFSVLAHETPEPPAPTMQTFNPDMLPNVGDTMDLEDERDGNIYTVRKLADGNVWMTQNLRIAGKTITSKDSNLPAGGFYIIPDSDKDSFTKTPRSGSVYIDDVRGGYYSFYTAMAGWDPEDAPTGQSSQDICPKGWRVPTGGAYGEYAELYMHYGSLILLQGDPALNRFGYIVDSNYGLSNVNSYGFYWSSTKNGDADEAYALYFSDSFVNHTSGDKTYNGYNVRCIAKKDSRTLSDVEYMQDLNRDISKNTAIGENAMLVDKRDGLTYTVKKLDDGNIWMTKNLRTMSIVLTSNDSNLDDGETYEIPESDLASFTSNSQTNSAYIDPEYGGYYNFYTATAGGRTDGKNGSQASGDICPKGWRLPTGNSGGELSVFSYDKYDGNPSLLVSNMSLNYPGYVINGKLSGRGDYVYLWSATDHGSDRAYDLYMSASSSYASSSSDDYKNYGYSIRCIAR